MNPLLELSAQESLIFKNTDFLHAKKQIIEKIIILFGQLKVIYQQSDAHQNFMFPKATDHQTGKVSKGENYRGLPYIVLDFPRLFERQTNIFTFRTMFWWGNEFSFTLHLGGDYAERYKSTLLENYGQLLDYDFFLCINESPWEYHFLDDNYVPLTLANRSLLQKQPFIKLSRRLSLEDFGQVADYGLATYTHLIRILGQ